jgi:hypothetical protein
MKVKQRGIVLAAALLALFSIQGCVSPGQTGRNPLIENDPGKDYATISGRDADLFAEGGKGSLTINNQASFDVIIFAGKVANDNVLGASAPLRIRPTAPKAGGLPKRMSSIRAWWYTT